MGHKNTRLRQAVWDTNGGICHLCGRRILSGQPWDQDHVIPQSKGGQWELSNLKPAHALKRHCPAKGNRSRQDKPVNSYRNPQWLAERI